ncbi:MAG: copper chaperone PCu(A)C [Anaerolineales bacterium]
MAKRFILVVVVLLLAALGACQTSTQTFSVENVWARSSVAGGNSAIYMTINNPTAQDDVLLSAQSSVANAVELHLSSVDANGVMSMKQQENIPVPANSMVELKPGGLHVMLIGLPNDLKVGDEFEVTLNFKNAGAITLKVPVKDAADAMEHKMPMQP